MRFVPDANVLVRAFVFAHRRSLLLLTGGEVIASAQVQTEWIEVLSRPAFDRYIPSNVRSAFLADLLRATETIEPDLSVTGCRDPKDDPYLQAAVGGRADAIVTCDEDLLVLDPFRGIRIHRP